jgi:hypothetical protein
MEGFTLQFLHVAKAENVNIYASNNSYVSFFNSPYYAHRENLAIDIYPTPKKKTVTAYSPVTGRIKKIYAFKPPTSKFFDGHNLEQLIIVESMVRSDTHIRLLHIDSELNVGDFVSTGDTLGTIVRSGFFDFWTAPHIHVEVRKNVNLIRAKGSEPIIPVIKGKRVIDNRVSSDSVFKVLSVEENYVLVKVGRESSIGKIYGLGCTLCEGLGILDGGIPHYPFGGAYLRSTHSVKVGDSVKLGSIILGEVVRIVKNLAFFKRSPLKAYINEARIRGISVFLNLRACGVIKIVPMTPNELQLVQGDLVRFTLK